MDRISAASVEKQCKFKRDKLGRLHVQYTRTGELFVFDQATKFKGSSAQSHANDLYKVLLEHVVQRDHAAACIVSDNGADWSMKSLLTIIAMGRLWRDLDLDVLIQ